MKRKKRWIRETTVEVGTTVEVDGVERDVTMEFACYPEEPASRDCPGCPAEAEFQGASFDDTGKDAEKFVNPDDFKAEALQKAEDEFEAAYDRYCEDQYERRWEGR